MFLRVHARLASLRVPRGVFLRLRARVVFFADSLRDVSAFARTACFFAGSLRDVFAFARTACFFAGSPRGCFCASARACFSLQILCEMFLRVHARLFFFLILYNLFFWGGRGTSTPEAVFLSRPRPHPLLQHCVLVAAFCTRSCFFCGSPRGCFCVCAQACRSAVNRLLQAVKFRVQFTALNLRKKSRRFEAALCQEKRQHLPMGKYFPFKNKKFADYE